MSEIQKFRKLDNSDSVQLIRFVLESGYRHLKSLNLSHELSNTNVVSLVESKLMNSVTQMLYH